MLLEQESTPSTGLLPSVVCNKKIYKLLRSGSFYVYVFKDPRPGKNYEPIYVGKGRYRRILEHNKVPHYNPILGRKFSKIRKAGLTVKIEIALVTAVEQQAFEEEERLVAHWGRIDLGTGCLCNLTNGGEGMSGVIASEQARESSRRNIERLNADPEFKKFSSERMFALNKDPNQIALRAELNKEKIRKLFSDPVFVTEHRAKSSAFLKALHKDPEFQQKQSIRSSIMATRERRRELYQRFEIAGLLDGEADSVGKLLARAITLNKLCTKELAFELGICGNTLRRLIWGVKGRRGTLFRTRKALVKVAAYLKMSPEALLEISN